MPNLDPVARSAAQWHTARTAVAHATQPPAARRPSAEPAPKEQKSVARNLAPALLGAAASVRIYIYDLSELFGDMEVLLDHLANETRQPGGCSHREHSCGLRQFGHELTLVRHLRQSPHVTTSPDEADLFLVPFASTLAYMYARSLKSRDCARCKQMESALISFLTEKHRKRWARCAAQDHVLLSLRCPSAHGHEMNNRGYTLLFNAFREPLRAIHLCLEPPPLAVNLAQTDAPSARYHGVLVPSLVDLPQMISLDYEARTAAKRTLLFFQGSALSELRTRVMEAMRTDGAADCVLLPQTSRFQLTRPAVHAAAMANSTFCFCPRGDTAIAKRQYDALSSRCIPVLAADAVEWAFASRVPPASFSLQVSEAAIAERAGGRRLLATLRALPAERIARLQRGLAAAWRRYRYGDRWAEGEVLDSVIAELADRVGVLRELGCAVGGPPVAAAAGDVLAQSWTVRLRARFDELHPPPARVLAEPLIALDE